MPRGTGLRPWDGERQGGVVWNFPHGTELVGAAFMALPVGRVQLGAQAGLLEAEVSADLRSLGPPSTCPSLRGLPPAHRWPWQRWVALSPTACLPA